MRLRHILIFGILASVGLVACSRRFDAQPSCNFVQNSDLRRVSWNSMTPLKLYVHESVPLAKYPELEKILREAIQEWNDVAGRELIRLEALHVGGDSTPKKDGYSMLYWMNTWETSAANEQARTTIYWSGSQIYEADIRINDKDHDFYVGSEETFSDVDFKSLMVHELGHALGLAHTITPKSVMNAALPNGYDRRLIGKSDIDSIRCEY